MGHTESWMERGNCATRHTVDPDWFFAPPGRGDLARTARLVCTGCPVTNECLSFALADMGLHGLGTHGIWGGTTVDQRRVLLGQLSRNGARRELARQRRALSA